MGGGVGGTEWHVCRGTNIVPRIGVVSVLLFYNESGSVGVSMCIQRRVYNKIMKKRKQT
jgi:hypothetical protein